MIKKSFSLSGHKTSIKLEKEFWAGLAAIAEQRQIRLREFIAYEDVHRKNINLASHLRVLVLLHYIKLQNEPDAPLQ